MNFPETWKRIAKAVNLNSDISNPAWAAFINPLVPVSDSDGIMTLKTVSNIIKKTVEDKYIDIIQEQARLITGEDYIIKIISEDKDHIEVPSLKIISRNSVSSRYNFANFIVGQSNQFAYAASVAVAEAPGSEYNPLFLYGDVGLGKTHLMHAIANSILERDPECRIAYITCEKFMNELLSAIRNRTNEKFRQKYRNLDVLLIDDIQFISGKEATQDEFFHTFNALYNDHKQIIMASDRHPNEIKTLTDRLRNRFSSGLLADIKPPDAETRIAILVQKTEEQGIDVDREIIDYIAYKIKSNIRDLEGALTKVLAYKKLINKPLNLATAEEALSDLGKKSGREELTIEKIQNVICETYGIKHEDLISKKRSKPLSTYRQIAEYLCRKHVKNTTLTEIAAKFGGQNHTSVRTAVEKIQSLMNENNDVYKMVAEIEAKL